jgi:hypothetical protein
VISPSKLTGPGLGLLQWNRSLRPFHLIDSFSFFCLSSRQIRFCFSSYWFRFLELGSSSDSHWPPNRISVPTAYSCLRSHFPLGTSCLPAIPDQGLRETQIKTCFPQLWNQPKDWFLSQAARFWLSFSVVCSSRHWFPAGWFCSTSDILFSSRSPVCNRFPHRWIFQPSGFLLSELIFLSQFWTKTACSPIQLLLWFSSLRAWSWCFNAHVQASWVLVPLAFGGTDFCRRSGFALLLSSLLLVLVTWLGLHDVDSMCQFWVLSLCVNCCRQKPVLFSSYRIKKLEVSEFKLLTRDGSLNIPARCSVKYLWGFELHFDSLLVIGRVLTCIDYCLPLCFCGS